jgi:glutamyl-tRNA reductase
MAPVELRERLAFDLTGAGAVAARLAADDGEAVALATCNRVCLYVVHSERDTARRRALDELGALARLPVDELEPNLYEKADTEAARHLFRVACGLDSLVPGEAQILGQVRAAYQAARASGAAGPVLHHLFRQALNVGKRVRSETGIGESPASVSSAAAELAARVFGDLERCSVLLVGAGTMGELAARNLVARGVGALVVANRSQARREELAARWAARAVGLDGLEEELGAADIVIAATGSEGFVLTAETVARAQRARRNRPLFLVDIAVPRDLDPAINELSGCYLYDVDDLQRVVQASIAVRREEAARAEELVGEEAARAEELVGEATELFRRWELSRGVVPAIRALRRRGEDIRESELVRASARLADLSPSERRAVESMTAQIVNKLLHVPTVRLKEAAATPDGEVWAEAMRELFDLRDPEQR